MPKKPPVRRAHDLLVRSLDRKSLGLTDAVRILAAGFLYVGESLETIAADTMLETKRAHTQDAKVLVMCIACRSLAWKTPGDVGCDVAGCEGITEPVPPRKGAV